MRLTEAIAKLFRPRAADPALDERFWAGEVSLSKAGQWVSPDTAEQYITLQACVDLFKKAFLMMPTQVLRYTEAGKVEVTNHVAGTILRKRPNPYQKPYQFKGLLMHQALLAGNAFAEIREGSEGPEMWPLAPANVEGPELLSSGRRRYLVTREGGRKESLLGDVDIMHATGLWLDSSGMRGKSIIDRAREALGMALAADSYGAKLFASGVKYPGVITMPGPLNDPTLRGAIADSFKRQSESGYPLLEQGMDFKSMGMTNDDAQFLETRKFSVSEVARLFGVPPHMIGDVERSTSWGAGIEAQTFQFVTYALLPWLTIWQECFEAVLVPEDDVHIRFNVGKLMQADMTSRFGVYKSAIDDGILSPNECRELEDWNPREGGDEYREEPRGNASGGSAPMPTKPEPMPMEDQEARAGLVALRREMELLRGGGDDSRARTLAGWVAGKLLAEEAEALMELAQKHAKSSAEFGHATASFYGRHAVTVAAALSISRDQAAAYCRGQRLLLAERGASALPTWAAENLGALVALALSGQPPAPSVTVAPVVNVAQPAITVTAPVVNVAAPSVTMPAPVVNVAPAPVTVNVEGRAPATLEFTRDKAGNVVRATERPVKE